MTRAEYVAVRIAHIEQQLANTVTAPGHVDRHAERLSSELRQLRAELAQLKRTAA